MNEVLFRRALRDVLEDRLPQDSSYIPSRKIEELMVRSEGVVTFNYVMFIIDTALTKEQFEQLARAVCQTLYKDDKLRESKYSFIVCSKDAVDNTRPRKQHWVRIKRIYTELTEYPYICDNNPDWESLVNECKKCYRQGQIILFTTEAKIKALEKYPVNVWKQSVVVYAAETATKRKETIAHVCALGLEPKIEVTEGEQEKHAN